jgi:hypothetical protein
VEGPDANSGTDSDSEELVSGGGRAVGRLFSMGTGWRVSVFGLLVGTDGLFGGDHGGASAEREGGGSHGGADADRWLVGFVVDLFVVDEFGGVGFGDEDGDGDDGDDGDGGVLFTLRFLFLERWTAVVEWWSCAGAGLAR